MSVQRERAVSFAGIFGAFVAMRVRILGEISGCVFCIATIIAFFQTWPITGAGNAPGFVMPFDVCFALAAPMGAVLPFAANGPRDHGQPEQFDFRSEESGLLGTDSSTFVNRTYWYTGIAGFYMLCTPCFCSNLQ